MKMPHRGFLASGSTSAIDDFVPSSPLGQNADVDFVEVSKDDIRLYQVKPQTVSTLVEGTVHWGSIEPQMRIFAPSGEQAEYNEVYVGRHLNRVPLRPPGGEVVIFYYSGSIGSYGIQVDAATAGAPEATETMLPFAGTRRARPRRNRVRRPVTIGTFDNTQWPS